MEKLTELLNKKLEKKDLNGIYRVNKRDVFNNIRNIKEIKFEVTQKCNLNCVYCAFGDLYEEVHGLQKKEMSIETVNRLFHFLSPHWKSRSPNTVLSIGFYGGEPLMNMKLIKSIIDEVLPVVAPFKYSYRITTNGLLLNNHIDYIADRNMYLMVSLDGNSVHNSYRVTHEGKDSFELVTRNVDELKEKHPSYFEDRVSFNVVLHNKNNANEVMKYFKDKYNKEPRLSTLVRDGVKKEKQEAFDKMNKVESYVTNISFKDEQDFVNSSLGKAMLQIMFILDMAYENYSSLIHPGADSKFRTGSCTPFQKIFVTAEGKMLPCEKVNHKYILADLYGPGEIDFNNAVNFHNELLDKFSNSICKKCFAKKLCHSCIYTKQWIDSGVVDFCSNFIDYRQYVEIQDNIVRYIANKPKDFLRMINFFS